VVGLLFVASVVCCIVVVVVHCNMVTLWLVVVDNVSWVLISVVFVLYGLDFCCWWVGGCVLCVWDGMLGDTCGFVVLQILIPGIGWGCGD